VLHKYLSLIPIEYLYISSPENIYRPNKINSRTHNQTQWVVSGQRLKNI